MIRRATSQDIEAIAAINRLSFSGNKPQGKAEQWVSSHFNQGDQYHYFVLEENEKIGGYISWELRGGFAREIPVIELEQLAVHPDFRGQGVGTKLVDQTFESMKQWVHTQQPEAKEMKVFVWTKKDNEKAKAIYLNICNEGEKGERNIYGTEECLLRGTYQL